MATPGRNSKSRPKRDIADVKGGLLTTLINLFDENETREVGKDHFVSFAAALGYDCPESSWQSLLSRFGSGPKQEGAFKRALGCVSARGTYSLSPPHSNPSHDPRRIVVCRPRCDGVRRWAICMRRPSAHR